MLIPLFQNLNNKRDSNVLNRSKSQSATGLHSKYESALRSKDNYSGKNINLRNQLNSGIKSDTYESVCPPEDVVERTKQANKNSVIRNNLDNNSNKHYSSNSLISANSNSSVNNINNTNNNHNIHSANSSGNNHSNHNNSNSSSNSSSCNNPNNINRNLKRVSSAPPIQNHAEVGKWVTSTYIYVRIYIYIYILYMCIETFISCFERSERFRIENKLSF